MKYSNDSSRSCFSLVAALTTLAFTTLAFHSDSFGAILVAQEVPDEYEQLLPRGGIPAIDDPKYVPAAEAEISDEAFVLGVVIEDQPMAFSLNLLNSHEIVNDTVGNTNFAAVW